MLLFYFFRNNDYLCCAKRCINKLTTKILKTMKKEMKRCALFMGKALTMLTLIALSLCMASCGDDDDDSGGGEGSIEQMMRKKWIWSYPDINGVDRMYADLSGSKAKVAFQYSKDLCNKLGLTPGTWYEGLSGTLHITHQTAGNYEYMLVEIGDYIFYSFDITAITKDKIDDSSKVCNEDVTTEKLPWHDLLMFVLGFWEDEDDGSFTNIEPYYGNLLRLDLKEIKQFGGEYSSVSGVSITVNEILYSTVSGETNGGSKFTFTKIDNERMQEYVHSNGKYHTLKSIKPLY